MSNGHRQLMEENPVLEPQGGQSVSLFQSAREQQTMYAREYFHHLLSLDLVYHISIPRLIVLAFHFLLGNYAPLPIKSKAS